MRLATLLLVSSALIAPTTGAAEPCKDALALQVSLDRAGFSPGVIDGKGGTNTTRALSAYRAAKGTTGTDDCTSVSPDTEPTSGYQITTEDAAGPFEPIPADIAQQAGRQALGYQSLLEKMSERFHATPALLQSLNPGVEFAAGATIVVPNVAPFDDAAKPAKATAPVSVEVTRQGELRVVDANKQVVMFAPVSSGSEHDPLPAGQWKVTGVSWRPPFHYNPALFWDAEATDQKALLPPGPNNPVGVVWIDINVKHYGLHGTPEPSRIGYGQSHGCVRLTNWDAARLASLVGPGTAVTFR